MNFTFTEEQLMIKQTAKEFAESEIAPTAIERDLKGEFPYEIVKKLGELGFMGMMVSPEWGGAGLDTISYVLAMEEISKIDASVGVIMSVNNSLVCWGLETYGTNEQKEKYLNHWRKEKCSVHLLFLNQKLEVMQQINTQLLRKMEIIGF